eukprot:363325-Chlamydomonas_euryale.AAC.3
MAHLPPFHLRCGAGCSTAARHASRAAHFCECAAAPHLDLMISLTSWTCCVSSSGRGSGTW